MTILFSANLAHQVGAPDNYHTVDTAGRDTALTPACIGFPKTTGASITVRNAAPDGEWWGHFRWVSANTATSTVGDFIRIFAPPGDTLVASVRRDGAVDRELRVRTEGSPTAASTYWAYSANSLYYIDIRVTYSGSDLTVAFYVDGSLVRSVTGARPTGVTQLPVGMTILNQSAVAGSGNPQYASEIILADEDTRGLRVASMIPNTFGTYTEWSGAIGTLTDYDTTTGVTASAASQRYTVNPTSFGGPGGATIREVRSTANVSRGAATAGVQHLLRISDTNYFTTTTALPPGNSVVTHGYALNPHTGAAWVVGDLSGVQFGLRSTA